MNVGHARPNVAHLVLRVFGRSIHPELFRSLADLEITHERYTASLHICEAGHLIVFRYADRIISEITASREQQLPLKKQCLEHKLRGCRDESIRFDGGLRYSVSYQVERLEPNVFMNYHEELGCDGSRASLFYRFPSLTRLSPEPLSLIRVDCSRQSLLTHAFHTFPENCTVLRTQSLFEF